MSYDFRKSTLGRAEEEARVEDREVVDPAAPFNRPVGDEEKESGSRGAVRSGWEVLG